MILALTVILVALILINLGVLLFMGKLTHDLQVSIKHTRDQNKKVYNDPPLDYP